MKYLLFIIIIISFSWQSTYASGNTGAIEQQEQSENESINGGVVPGLASVFPGILLHGTGHYIAGDKETAIDLLVIEGAGFGVLLGSAIFYGYTGASDMLSPVLIPLMLTGAGVFVHSWICDIYGSSTGFGRPGSGEKNTNIKYIKPFAGITYVNDIQFNYSGFFHSGIDIKYNALYAKPELWLAVANRNYRYVLEAGYEIAGPNGVLFKKYENIFTVRPLIRPGYHDFSEYGFNKRWIDACIETVIYPGEIWKTMKGLFLLFELGCNREWVAFPVIDDDPVLVTGQLLFETGFGIDIGKLSSPMGCIYLYYNHRRDDFTGGFRGGFTGYLGMKADVKVYKNIFLMIDYSYGSAAVLNLNCGVKF